MSALDEIAAIVQRAERQSLRDAVAEVVRRYERRASTNELIAALQAEVTRLEASEP